MKLLTFGGGTNSTALLIEIVRRKIEVDYILFSDTGGERPKTYKHVAYMDKWIRSKGYPGIITVQYKTKDGKNLNLEQFCHKYKSLRSIIYGFKSCSLKFKKTPIDKFMKSQKKCIDFWNEGNQIIKIIGIDADEHHRTKKIYDDDKYKVWYPLIEWDYGREECIEIIKNANIPLPGKSSCFFCPSMKVQEVKQLASCNPELFDRAIAIEDNANLKEGTSIKGLGGKYSWRRLIDQEKSQVKMFDLPVACDCYDG